MMLCYIDNHLKGYANLSEDDKHVMYTAISIPRYAVAYLLGGWDDRFDGGSMTRALFAVFYK